MLLFKVISTIVLLNLIILLYLAYAHMDFDKEVEHIYRETIGLSIILFTISILFVWL